MKGHLKTTTIRQTHDENRSDTMLLHLGPISASALLDL